MGKQCSVCHSILDEYGNPHTPMCPLCEAFRAQIATLTAERDYFKEVSERHYACLQKLDAQPNAKELADEVGAMKRHSLALADALDVLTAERDRYKAALRPVLHELENLFAMVEGECPSLLEDHHSYPNIVAAIEAGNEAISPTPGE